MAREWFSSPDYSPEAMRDFESRLARARPHHHAQYLGLKALYLAEMEIPEADQIAIALLHRVFNGHSGISFELVSAHETLGSIYERMGRFEDAEREYRWVVNSYREGRSGSSGVCEVTLAELIIRTEQTNKYAEAADLLTQAANSRYLLSKPDWLRYWIAAARLSHRLGRHNDAADFAQRALGLADAKESRKPRNSRFGNEYMDSETRRELLELSTAGMPVI